MNISYQLVNYSSRFSRNRWIWRW